MSSLIHPAAGRVRVTLPVFSTRKRHTIVSPLSMMPSPSTSVTWATAFVRVIEEVGASVRVTVLDGLVGFGPSPGGTVPVTLAALTSLPRSTSFWLAT